jgi:hypothetical protein
MKNLFKKFFGIKDFVPVSRNFKPGDMVSYSPGEYGEKLYGCVISPEDYVRLSGEELPDEKKWLENYVFEVKINGLLYLESHEKNGDGTTYLYMPARIVEKIDDVKDEIKRIQDVAEYQIKDIMTYRDSSLNFLRNKLKD